MSTAFSYQLRVLLCPQCGAPVEVSPAGGVTPCRYCGAHAEMGVRDETLDAVLRPQRQPIPEQERLARLRQQTGKPLMPPGNVFHLFDKGEIPPWRMGEALAVWQTLRRESQATFHPEAGEGVYFLAMGLSSVYGEGNDTPRQRAVLESSLEVLRLPRHRQALRGILARLACRSGDPAAGEHWLAPCDQASDDLEMDTAYRFSRAVIATARGDFAGVRAALGSEPGEVPLLEAMETVTVAFRANAIERMGDVAGAARQLAAFASQSPLHAQRMQKTLAYWAALGICPQSQAPADAARKTAQGNAAAARSGGGIGLPFAIIGGLLAVAGAVLLVSGLLSGSAAPHPTAGRHGKGAPPPVVASPSAAPQEIAGASLLGMGLLFGGIGAAVLVAGKNARRLAMTGEHCEALVTDVSSTGLSINNLPQYAFTLKVQRTGGQPPYAAVAKALGASHIARGMTVPVIVDPQNPTKVILELPD